MDLFILVLTAFFFLAFHDKVGGANWNLSNEYDLKFETQLNLLTKPTIRSIKTEYGDLYDCVDFFKQPAFDHPLLKNTSDFQVLPPSILNTMRNQRSKTLSDIYGKGFKGLECPIGTVPIRRVTKENLMKKNFTPRANIPNDEHVRLVYSKTKPGTRRYSGAGARISVHNPKATGAQYSASRLKVINEHEVIQAGWRVDQKLYHDTHTRFFIHTDAIKTHCFNTFCPGFVIIRHDFFLGGTLPKISVPGQNPYTILVSILKDHQYGMWNLQVGPNRIVVGYWPSKLFIQLTGLATSLVWGAETYSPPGIDFPPMGSGSESLKRDIHYDAFFAQMSAYDEDGNITDPNDLDNKSDPPMYSLIDLKHYDDKLKHVVVYTGAGGFGKQV